jgi:AcrR family transcriptional regulator
MARRIGTESSKTRALLVDVTERLMLEEGYAAVSSRRVAALAEVKPALVHYYFPTMDDLFLAVFRRGAERTLERFAAAAGSDRPLRSLWRLAKDQRGARFLMEFSALSRHRGAVRSEIAEYAERFRTLQLHVVRRTLAARGVPDPIVTAEAVVVLLTSVSTTMVLERGLGMTTGHAEAIALVEHLVDLYEPAAGEPAPIAEDPGPC